MSYTTPLKSKIATIRNSLDTRSPAVTIRRNDTMSTETPLDLKKTINLPKTGFSQKANLAQANQRV